MHRLLRRQLRRNFGDSNTVPEEWQGFIDAVDQAYEQFDQDRNLLERSLDLSGQELMETNAKLRNVLDDLTHELSERKRAEEELKRRAVELVAVNSELESMSYTLSHDLSAPLRALDSSSSSLMDKYADKLGAEGAEEARSARNAGERMRELIDDMVSMSRVLTLSGLDPVELEREEVDLSALARTVAEQLRERDPRRQVEFVLAEGVVAAGDAGRLRAALEELLTNAWKFTGKHAQARIEFGKAEDGGDPVYFVRDDGAGFDMAEADQLFGAFQRLSSAADFDGLGVGLATVHRIIRSHGGRIWAESEVERGATFYFSLS